MNWAVIQAQAAIAPIDGRDDLVAPPLSAVGAATAASPAGEFARLVGSGLEQVNGQLMASQVSLQRLATGDVQNLHHIMMELEETKVSFQLFLQVRNRMLEAYQDLMKMQI